MIDIRKSFSTKLSLTVLLLAVPVFFISLGILFTHSRRMIREEAVGRVNSTLNTTMQRLCRHLNSVETATNAISMFIPEQLHPDSILALTRFIVSFNPSIDGCSISMEPDVFPEYGRYFSAYTIRQNRVSDVSQPDTPFIPDSIITVIEEPYDYFSKDWYRLPRQKDAPYWVDFFDETDSLEVTLEGMISSFGRPIHDLQGRLVGIISSDISLRRVSKVISQEKPYPNSYFMMVNEKGQYIVHPDSSRLFSQSIFDEASPSQQPVLIALGHEMTKGNTGNMFLDLEGVHSLVTYQRVPGTLWSLALVCPDDDILSGYNQQTYIVLPLLVIGLIFILLLCHHSVAHSIRPLNELLVKTQTIASGNMEVYIPRSQREDAIGSLQNSFASMLQRLNFHMGSVRYTTELAQRRYEELAEATRLAEEANQQKTEFIQNISHQIRTPLNIIMGFTQILSNSPRLNDEEMKVIATTIDHNSKILYRMALMLFDSSDTGLNEELKSNKHVKVGCNKLAHAAIEYINIHFPDININFHTDVADDLCIKTNSLYLERTLRELLFNAAKYSDGQHLRLIVTTHLSDKPDNAHKTVFFIVEDTGKGIDDSHRERMFAFFTKIDSLSEGLGLGLPLAKRHIFNLGGELTMDPDYHDGCRFIVSLPL